jgi:hypothetical protein
METNASNLDVKYGALYASTPGGTFSTSVFLGFLKNKGQTMDSNLPRHFSRRLLTTTLATCALAAGLAQAAVVTVTPSSMGTWAFYATDSGGVVNSGSGTGQMVAGPGTPPLGSGSANLNVGAGHGDQSVQLRNSDWAGTRLADLTSLSYSTYSTSFNGSQLPFVNLYLNYGAGNTRDDRLWFEPTYSSASAGNGNLSPQSDVALATWQTWNMFTGMWYSDSGTPNSSQFPGDGNGAGDHAITLAVFIAAHPDATIINDPGQGGLGGIRIASGFASASDNFNTNVDAFTIGTARGSSTYDFELDAAKFPEPGTLALLGLGMAGLAYTRRNRQ